MDNPYGYAEDNHLLRPLPNSTLILVLGILSLLGVCCYGFMGILLGVIALVLARQEQKRYNRSPAEFTASSYSQLKIGRICAILGLVLSLLFFGFVALMIMLMGVNGLQDPDKFREVLETYIMI